MPHSDEIKEEFVTSPTNPVRILVVEDHAANILVITGYLDLLGYTHEVARNGKEAVLKAATGHYALILMDIKMQSLDGFETTRQIRKFESENGKRPVPIIAVTAHAMPGDKERCLAAGMDGYITKPIDYSILKDKLVEVLAD